MVFQVVLTDKSMQHSIDETYYNIYLDKYATITKKTRAAFNRFTNYM